MIQNVLQYFNIHLFLLKSTPHFDLCKQITEQNNNPPNSAFNIGIFSVPVLSLWLNKGKWFSWMLHFYTKFSNSEPLIILTQIITKWPTHKARHPKTLLRQVNRIYHKYRTIPILMHICSRLPQKYVNSFTQGSPYTKYSSELMH